MRSRGVVGVLAMAAALSLPLAGGATNTFIPDWTFKGSTLTGWHVLGQASWRVVARREDAGRNERRVRGVDWGRRRRLRRDARRERQGADARSSPRRRRH